MKYFLFCIITATLFTFQVSAQQSDTIFTFYSEKNNSKLEIIDFYLRNNSSYVILYSENKELFIIDSEKPEKIFKLNARLASVSGDKYSQSQSIQVKEALLYNEGYLAAAASDQNHDQLGGRFLRWDLKKQQNLPDIITSSEGIGKFAISNNGRYFINYYYPKPGKKIEIIDALENKHYKIKTKEIIYADKIYFTENDKKLVFKGSWVNDKFGNVVFDVPSFKKSTESNVPEEAAQNHFKLNNFTFSLENDSLIIKNTSSGASKSFYIASKAKISSNDNLVLLALVSQNKIKIVKIVTN